MQEWLDIVDLNDRVIGRDSRQQVHARRAMHRASHILLFNSQGQVFVQLRSQKKDEAAGLWDTSVAGHVDSGEDYLACAVRELAEELGIAIDPSKLTWVDKLPPDESNGFEFTSLYYTCSDQPLILNPEEIDDGRWLLPAELDTWIDREPSQFTGGFRVIWPIVRTFRFS